MKYLLIDANSIGHAAHHATKLSAGDLQTQAIFGFIKTMRQLRQDYPQHVPLVLWDGKAQWRFDLTPEYKSNRTDDPKKVADKQAYTEQRPYISKALRYLGIRQVTASTHEADDLAGYFVASLSVKPDNEIELITGDQDWLQLVRPNVSWRDLRDDSRRVNHLSFFDKTGYKTPYAFLEGKCLQGDTSDCISGVGGIGEKGAPVFLAEYGSVSAFWKRVDSGELVPKGKVLQRFAQPDGRALYRRNFRMMQLLKVNPPAKENLTVDNGEFDEQKFRELCEDLAFGSILRDVQGFVKYFKKG